jgi:hypothetical protein
MNKIRSVRLQCSHCGASFPPPVPITTMEELDGFAAWGGIVDCVHCHHFVVVGRDRLSHGHEGTSAGITAEP